MNAQNSSQTVSKYLPTYTVSSPWKNYGCNVRNVAGHVEGSHAQYMCLLMYCILMLYLCYNQSFVIDVCAVDLLNYKRPDKSRSWFWWAEGHSNLVDWRRQQFGGLEETAVWWAGGDSNLMGWRRQQFGGLK